MIRHAQIAQMPGMPGAPQVLEFANFGNGLNTFVPADKIALTEASRLVNWAIRKGGSLASRLPVAAYTAAATTSNAAVKTTAEANIGGTLYTLIVDANHILYYLDGDLEPVAIGTLEGAATILSFNGVALIMDGGYLKFLDGVAAANLKMAYDAGTGTSAFQFDKTALSNDTYLELGNGTNIGVAQKFTTPAWTAGYTLPPVTVSAYLSENGSAVAGAITAKIRSFAAPETVLASMTFVADASTVGGTAAEFSATFTAAEISAKMAPETAYFCTLEYSAGDASNYIKVHCHTEASGGLAYSGITDLAVIGNWSADATKNCLMSLTPGHPPKAKFGAVWNKRPFIAGDPDNPGYLWYGNLTHLDWSTSNGGGYIGVIDGDSDNFEVGAIESFYGQLMVFGTQDQPYLVRLSGAQPSEYAQETAFQKPWATHKTLVSAVNDLWYATNEGVSPLSGVQEYGDLRTFFASDPVQDRFEDYWATATAIAGYYPMDGQYFLAMPAHHKVLVCHTKQAAQGPDGATRYPWAEFEFYRHDLSAAAYKWTASGDGTNEYYLELAAGGDPGFDAQPDFITLNGVKMTEGTAGALADHQWDYGDNDALGYSTVYWADASGDPDATGISLRSILIPTAFGQASGLFLIGGSDGYLYKLDASGYKDQGSIQIQPVLETAYVEFPFTFVNFTQMQVYVSSLGGGAITVNYYTNDKFAETTATTSGIALRDNMTVDDAVMTVDEALSYVDTAQNPLFSYINFGCRSLMLKIDDVTIAGYPIYFQGVRLKYRGYST